MTDFALARCTANALVWLQIDDWEFNIFELDKLTQGRALYTVCMTLMEKEGLLVRHCMLLLWPFDSALM